MPARAAVPDLHAGRGQGGGVHVGGDPVDVVGGDADARAFRLQCHARGRERAAAHLLLIHLAGQQGLFILDADGNEGVVVQIGTQKLEHLRILLGIQVLAVAGDALLRRKGTKRQAQKGQQQGNQYSQTLFHHGFPPIHTEAT